jgi:thiol-disulfide isomerase/thioredoxin
MSITVLLLAALLCSVLPAPAQDLVLDDYVPCGVCENKIRKRVAVMPVKVGVLSRELGLPGEVVADRVQTQVESALSGRKTLKVVARADLPSVLREQQLANSALFNQELAPATGRLIPAQLLIHTTVERFDLRTQIDERVDSSEAEGYMESARQADEMARIHEESAARAEKTVSDSMSYGNGGTGVAIGLAFLKTQADMERRSAEQKRREANDYRLRAQTATTKVIRTETKLADLRIVWRALDTETGAVVARGTAGASDRLVHRGESSRGTYHSNSRTETARPDVLVNGVIDKAVQDIARQVDDRAASEPFRAKVVKASSETVLLNAGSDLGVSVGDTFGVRQKPDPDLLDPDTGEYLDVAGPPVGVIRVESVSQKVSTARVLRSAGSIDRGDQLEWIGMYITRAEAERQERERKEAQAARERFESDANALASRILDAFNSGDQLGAVRMLPDFEQAYSSSSSAARLAPVRKATSWVGKSAPATISVERWFQGKKQGVALHPATDLILYAFFEPWCPHCRREAPVLESIHQKYQGKGLRVVGLTKQTKNSTKSDVKQYITNGGLSFPVAKDSGELSSHFNITGIPAVAVVKGGTVVWQGHPAALGDETISRFF